MRLHSYLISTTVLVCVSFGQCNQIADDIYDIDGNFYVIVQYHKSGDSTNIKKRCVLFKDVCSALLIDQKLFSNSDIHNLRSRLLSSNAPEIFGRKKSIKYLDARGISFEEVVQFKESDKFINLINNKLELLNEVMTKSNVLDVDAIYFYENGILRNEDLIIFWDNWNLPLDLLAGALFTDGVISTLRHGPELVVCLSDFYNVYKNNE
jgi:hypothetical protein